MAQQTAVEWLIEQLHSESYENAFGRTYVSPVIINEAKQMEKEQIINAWRNGDNDSIYNFKELDKLAEQYYNETYNK